MTNKEYEAPKAKRMEIITKGTGNGECHPSGSGNTGYCNSGNSPSDGCVNPGNSPVGGCWAGNVI
jgi:hypothetical protein